MNRGNTNPLGLGLVLVGAVVMALATFLPLDDVAGQGQVRENSLIQHGGWMLILVAVAVAAGGFGAFQKRGRNWLWPFFVCLYAGYRVIDWGVDTSLRTLYPVKLDGSLDTSGSGTVVPLGIAIYVAGAGVMLALLGSLLLRETEQGAATPVSAAAERQNKKCPDCAETVLSDAKVCKHCNYLFPTTYVRCHRCQHRWPVLADLAEFNCERCGVTLRRKAGAQDV